MHDLLSSVLLLHVDRVLNYVGINAKVISLILHGKVEAALTGYVSIEVVLRVVACVLLLLLLLLLV